MAEETPRPTAGPVTPPVVRPRRLRRTPGLRRLVAETAADNEASNRVLAGAGFTVWGREEAADAPDGSVGPALHWERLA